MNSRLAGYMQAVFMKDMSAFRGMGKNEPSVAVPAVCAICGRKTQEGIVIEHDGTKLGFCTNRHYVQWWKTIHDDKSLKPEHFESPEERYKDKDR